MVPDLRGVVVDATAAGFDDFFEALALELGTGHQVVEVDHIGVVVLAMVIFQGLPGNVGCQGVERVGKFGKGKRHDNHPFSLLRESDSRRIQTGCQRRVSEGMLQLTELEYPYSSKA